MFIDFTNDPEINISWYGHGDHIIRELRERYTLKFFETVSEAFR